MKKNLSLNKLFKILSQGLAFIFLKIKLVFSHWPYAFISVIAAILIAYYPIGGLISEKIDRSEDYDLEYITPEQSQTVEMMSQLINREVNEHIWTVNLPFFYPSYSLDNMPNFQRGIIRAIALVSKAMAKQVQCPNSDEIENKLAEAAKLLAYPADVWLFAPDNKLKIAPSSSSQYRKARKKLKDFNVALQNEKCFWLRDNKSLSAIVGKISSGLSKAGQKIEEEIREGSNLWTATAVDDVFYYNQGQIYAYMIILKKLGRDYKQLLVAYDLYSEWTSAVRALQNGSAINPRIVVNGAIDGSLKPNHLLNLGYYLTKGENILLKINQRLIGEKK